jgi:hypothetical protein
MAWPWLREIVTGATVGQLAFWYVLGFLALTFAACWRLSR